MFASMLLTFREGLEAALIVGIILGYLGQLGQTERRPWVWAAVGAALALSLGLALALQAAGARLEGRAEMIFEGLAMLLAVIVLTWMIVWMRAQARHLKSALETDIRAAVRRPHSGALFSLTFLAVFREGVETALFLTAASFVSGSAAALAGGVLGLAAAVVTGWAIYSSTLRLNLRRFFDVTSALLLVFAAGLFAHSLHEFQEAGWLPGMVEHVWNSKPLLDDGSTIGSLLRVLVGYNDDPSLLEVIGYVLYWAAVLGGLKWWASRRAAAPRGAVPASRY